MNKLEAAWLEHASSQNALDYSEQKELLSAHQKNFQRRVRRLPRDWLPSNDNSPEAIESLGNASCASFCAEPCYEGMPAFVYTVFKSLPSRGFLYTWRSSATIAFLRRNGSDSLRERLKTFKNMRVRLRDDFAEVGHIHGERLWWIDEDAPERLPTMPINLANAPVIQAPKITKSLIRTLMKAFGVPLTRTELALIVLQARGQLQDAVMVADDAQNVVSVSDRASVMDDEIKSRAVEFFERLTLEERRLLQARGYGAANAPRVSHRVVAEKLGGRGAESFRQMEKSILQAFAAEFEQRDEAEVAVEVLVDLLNQEGES